jgi:hypothetical protein
MKWNKQFWLDGAEIADAYRVVPRILILGWMGFYMEYAWFLTDWFFTLAAPTLEQTTFVTTVISALGTMSIWLGNIYVNSRRKWGYESDSVPKDNTN